MSETVGYVGKLTLHYLGINRHVAMHRDKRQRCKVTYNRSEKNE